MDKVLYERPLSIIPVTVCNLINRQQVQIHIFTDFEWNISTFIWGKMDSKSALAVIHESEQFDIFRIIINHTELSMSCMVNFVAT